MEIDGHPIRVDFSIIDNRDASKCVGVFGLSLHTQERDIRDIFSRFGPLEDCFIVTDGQVYETSTKHYEVLFLHVHKSDLCSK